ncbi:E3 ubiquitin-protein ligase MARCH6 [Apostasia shenzhenica]|uniref:E3 ubiquitin-protein ligase MARCH6 n=1 Tax=Apostasia shenzhenica TaxID=1088818 RepID=A0A2I0B541_9ASPA|nr:E3 ubiquitin-protein ligase MARCH6 [Apostasia shenzhenica]
MGEHLALLVDRLLTESTLAATIESRRKPEAGQSLVLSIASGSELAQKNSSGSSSYAGKLVECRICQDEDEDCSMEIPCSCRGSLKYAHRKCIQQWCNEKGDTTCEICLQQFKPGYTAPPQLFHYGNIPMNFRGTWEVSQRELNDSHIITMVPSERSFVNTDYDYYESSSTRSSVYCRSVAVIFTGLLLLRHTLPVLLRGAEDAEQHSFTLFLMLLFCTTGTILPVIVMIKVLIPALLRHRHHQVFYSFHHF